MASDDDNGEILAVDAKPGWYEHLPRPLAWVADFIYLDQVDPGDTFVVLLRKMLIGLGLMLFPFPMAYPIYNIYQVRDSSKAGHVMSYLAMPVYCFTWLIVFIILKLRRGKA